MTCTRSVLLSLLPILAYIVIAFNVSCRETIVNMKEASVAIELSGVTKTRLCYIFTDDDDVKNLVVDPMNSSTIIQDPEKYVVLGHIVLKNANGDLETVSLFKPLGTIKYRNAYRTANFSRLKERIIKINEIAREQYK